MIDLETYDEQIQAMETVIENEKIIPSMCQIPYSDLKQFVNFCHEAKDLIGRAIGLNISMDKEFEAMLNKYFDPTYKPEVAEANCCRPAVIP